MSAFGRKNGVGGMAAGARPSFGVARPMKGGSGKPSGEGNQAPGGDQFPPLPGESGMPPNKGDAMTRLADRANHVDSGKAEIGGFEASVQKIKEQEIVHTSELQSQSNL